MLQQLKSVDRCIFVHTGTLLVEVLEVFGGNTITLLKFIPRYSPLREH
jgi:hypothetical protein